MFSSRFLKLTACLVPIFCSACGILTSDEEMIDKYKKHRSEFNELARMFLQDKEIGSVLCDGSTINADSRDHRNKLDSKRRQRYIELLGELSFGRISRGVNSEEIDIDVYSSGLCDEGESKGYYYSRKRESIGKLRESLNSYPRDKTGFYYRPIGDGWYLYVDVYR